MIYELYREAHRLGLQNLRWSYDEHGEDPICAGELRGRTIFRFGRTGIAALEKLVAAASGGRR